jgi:hypothetical protein
MGWRAAVSTLAIGVPCLAGAADSAHLVTILEGDGQVIRGSTRYALVEGMRILPEDIVETGKGTFAQLEMNDGVRVDIGPGTRAWLPAKPIPDKGGARAMRAYLVSGWVKLSGANPQSAFAGFGSARLDLRSFAGVTVAMLAGDEAQVFAESGNATLSERRDKGPPSSVVLKSGDFYARTGDDKSTIGPRPSAKFLEQMPRPFRDTLPSRTARFKDRQPPALKPIGEISYADVEVWLKSETPLRRQFMQRWRTKASDPAFRSALIANLKHHPEWDPILFPEKYLPKKPPEPQPLAPVYPLPAR